MADTLIGPADEIKLPTLKEAQKTTAEAELGIIMGKDCLRCVRGELAGRHRGLYHHPGHDRGVHPEGQRLCQRQPPLPVYRENFPTFFSFGPQLVTPDEVPDVLKLEVQSVRNGEVYAKNLVSNMTHRPARLVSLHSSIQGWYAGDILSTGTPRAFEINDRGHGRVPDLRSRRL